MDTPETTHLSLCAGYGGIDLGLRRVLPDVRTVAYVEIESFAVANLVAKMEAGELDAAPVWTDLKTLPLEVFRDNVSIISGGFPCQPFSAAGKREGDDDPRHLFPYVKNAIRTIQPRIVFLENVEGIISAKLKGDGWEDPAGTPVLLHVLRELERIGYRCAWGVFSAAEVGAPHQRKRVFILANSEGARLEGHFGVQAGCGESRRNPSQPAGSVGGSNCGGTFWPARPGETQQEWEEPRVIGAVGNAESRQDERGESGHMGEAEQGGESSTATVANSGAELADTNSNESPTQRGDDGEVPEVPEEQGEEHCAVVSRGEGEEREQRQAEPVMGRAVDGIAGGVDATANRVDRLRILGNGVVAQTAEVAFRTLWEELNNE